MSGYPEERMRTIYTIVKYGEGEKQTRWSRVGVGFVNRDGSITLKLDALPVNGELQVREYQRREREEGRRRDAEDPFDLPSGLGGRPSVAAEQAA